MVEPYSQVQQNLDIDTLECSNSALLLCYRREVMKRKSQSSYKQMFYNQRINSFEHTRTCQQVNQDEFP